MLRNEAFKLIVVLLNFKNKYNPGEIKETKLASKIENNSFNFFAATNLLRS
jgi:hypothetical protein